MAGPFAVSSTPWPVLVGALCRARLEVEASVEGPEPALARLKEAFDDDRARLPGPLLDRFRRAVLESPGPIPPS